jgi:hypothetical protein
MKLCHFIDRQPSSIYKNDPIQAALWTAAAVILGTLGNLLGLVASKSN